MGKLKRLFKMPRRYLAIGASRIRTVRGTAGFHDDGFAGVMDVLSLAQGATVLDVGCNRGLLSFELAMHGATLIHGCDLYEQGIDTAREIFAELPIASRFEVVDLAGGSNKIEEAFGRDYRDRYDIVQFLAVFNKLKRQISDDQSAEIIRHLANRTGKYFVFRCRVEQVGEVERVLTDCGLLQVHFSRISEATGPASIWKRPPTALDVVTSRLASAVALK